MVASYRATPLISVEIPVTVVPPVLFYSGCGLISYAWIGGKTERKGRLGKVLNSVTNSEPNQDKNLTDDPTEGQNEGHEPNRKKDTENYKVLFGHQLLPFISTLARQPPASFDRALWQRICYSHSVIMSSVENSHQEKEFNCPVPLWLATS